MAKEIKTPLEYEDALKSAGNNLVVLDFFATWCGPCKEIAPKLDQMAEEFANVVFLKIDAADNDECKEICESFEIDWFPTFVLQKNGETVERFKGAKEDDEQKLRAAVETHK